jgi:hypothetical protein
LTGNVFLTISGFTDGALDMGSTDYLSVTGVATSIFTGTGLLSGGNTVTITVTVSTSGASLPRSGSGTTMACRPAPTLLDAAGNVAAGSITTGSRSSERQSPRVARWLRPPAPRPR